MAQRAQITDLELYLRERSVEGRLDSEGEFTIARRKALEKLAKFQLPFEGAWAVKVIQAIVAGGPSKPIDVQLLSGSMCFYFEEPGFSIDEIAESFFDPEPSNNRALNHLLSGLWVVALANSWSFQVALQGEGVTLIWDGSDFKQVASKQLKDRCSITVVNPGQSQCDIPWFTKSSNSASINADILLTIEQNCFVCPVPLCIDRRRVDALQKVALKGWSTVAYPLALGAVESDLSSFTLPSATFDKQVGGNVKSDNLEDMDHCWDEIAEHEMSALTAIERASLVYMLVVHVKSKAGYRTKVLVEDKNESFVFWVLDGVVTDQDLLFSGYSHCSLGCFVSASGLETDISTFRLLASEEKERRLALTKVAMLEAAPKIKGLELEKLFKSAKQESAYAAKFLAVLGLFSLPFSFGATGVFMGLSAVGLLRNSYIYKGKLEDVEQSLEVIAKKISDEAGRAKRNLGAT